MQAGILQSTYEDAWKSTSTSAQTSQTSLASSVDQMV